VPNTRRRRLTERGIKFLSGDLEVPKTLIEDPLTNEIIPSKNTKYVKYTNYKNRGNLVAKQKTSSDIRDPADK
jgi:hypothetical protein